MTSNQEFTVKIQPLTAGVEVEKTVDNQLTLPSLEGQVPLALGVGQGNLVRFTTPQVEVNHRMEVEQGGSELKYYGASMVPPRKRQAMNTVDTPSSSSEGEGSLVSGIEGQVQLLDRIASLEAELTRTRWEVTQLRELNTHLQQGIPHVIRRTLRDELNTCTCKSHSVIVNPSDMMYQHGSTNSQRQRGGHGEGKQKHHKHRNPQSKTSKDKDTPSTMTKKMLMKCFGRDTLATSTLTGKGGKSKTLTKAQLDPSIVKSIIDKVIERFGISQCVVRNIISQKCKEEMVIRRRRLTLEMKTSDVNIHNVA